MTIEQKAKSYDEAFERAKKLYEQGTITESLAHVFPELKESGDERIRKFLHNTFTVQYLAKDELGKWHGEPVSNILAWLERQGKPVEINPTEFDTRLQALIGNFDSLPKEELIGSLSFWLNVVQNDGTYKEEKQGEVPVTINIDKMVEDYANNEDCDNEGFGKPVNCMIRAYRQGLTDAIVILNLRKQGEQNPIMAKSPQLGEQKPAISDDALREGIAHFGITQYQIDNWLKKYVDVENQQKPADKVEPKDYNSIDPHFGKPVDKVKPKFHEGEWITIKE